MKNLLIGLTIATPFWIAIYFGSLGQFWNATGWTLLTFAIIMLIIQHENHKAELTKKEEELFHKTDKLCRVELSRDAYEAMWKQSKENAMQQFRECLEFAEERNDIKQALPTAEELEDPELREFYSLVIEEIKHQNS